MRASACHAQAARRDLPTLLLPGRDAGDCRRRKRPHNAQALPARKARSFGRRSHRLPLASPAAAPLVRRRSYVRFRDKPHNPQDGFETGANLPICGGNHHFQNQARRLFTGLDLDVEDIIGVNPQASFIGKALRLVNRQKAFAACQLQDQAANRWKRKPAEREGERDEIAGPDASRLAQKPCDLARLSPNLDRGEANRRILAWLRRQAGGGRRLRRIARGHAATVRRTMRLALIPPKAKELVRAVLIGMGRASFGTASTGHLASASRQLMVGGATFSRTAPIVTTSSSAPAAPSACP